MKPSININYQDSKCNLLDKIFNVIDSDKVRKIYARNGIKNINKMSVFVKIFLTSLYFDYTISDLIYEIQTNNKLKKFLGVDDEFNDPAQIYSYMSNLNEQQVVNIVNSILSQMNSKKRGLKTLIVDGTSIECDINHIKQYISKERLEKLKLKWGFSETKKHFIGFKLTMTLDKDTLIPVSILIHAGAPNDAKIFPEILEELKRRRLIKNGDRILFDRGYYSQENYTIGILRYKIVPIIFPRKSFSIQKLKDTFSYPLEVFDKKTNSKLLKKTIKKLFKILIRYLENWKDLKPVRGIIEDFFKVTKQAFNMDKLHKYTTKSIVKTAYFCILLTTIAINNGYNTKTGMQQLAEGKLNQKPLKKNTNKNKNKNQKNKNNDEVPYENKNKQCSEHQKYHQTKLELFV